MLKSLYAGISGMHAFQTKLDVIGNNIANVNTVGFKAGRAMFSDILSQTLQGGSAGTAGTGGAGLAGTNPEQVGLGTQISSIDTIFTDGSPETTNNPTDVAISGNGFFQVTDGTNKYYTRAGNFQIDNAGNLCLPNGFLVCDNSGAPINIGTGQFQSITPDGKLNYTDSSGAAQTPIQIGLAVFSNPSSLEKVGDNMYKMSSNTAFYGSVTDSSLAIPGDPTSGTNPLRVGALEMSNVDLTNEFSDMIIAQQGFNANSKIITTDQQILQTLTNMKQ